MNSAPWHDMLDVLCPMHVIFDLSGTISHAGLTALKIAPEITEKKQFLDIFEIKRPREIASMAALAARTGVRLNLRLRSSPDRQLQGVVMPGPLEGQMIVNLSFGISIVDAVRDLDLTASDFAPTDLTVEMLYLVEAKSAAMEASRQLNERLQRARVEAEKQALTDTLTGLQNRRGMDHELAAALRSGEPFALMHVDLDFFKTVNDTLGHAAGDHVLFRAAEIMIGGTRKSDVVFRVGGDEFVLLLKGSEDRELLGLIAERIIRRLEDPIPFEDKICRISASIGCVTVSATACPTADTLLGDADAALYAAKRSGRGRYLFFDPWMRDTARIA